MTEKIEWTWADRPEKADESLPNVLLLGDSISRAYYPATERAMQGKANVYLFATSACVADPRYVEQLQTYFKLAGVSFAVIHFNNGMHGWSYTDTQYAAALPGAVKALHRLQPRAKLVWANTTPVRADSRDGATNQRIDTRNRSADAAMQRLHVPQDDQHSLMQDHGALHEDDVHWNAAGSEIQAGQVANSIQQALPSR